MMVGFALLPTWLQCVSLLAPGLMAGGPQLTAQWASEAAARLRSASPEGVLGGNVYRYSKDFLGKALLSEIDKVVFNGQIRNRPDGKVKKETELKFHYKIMFPMGEATRTEILFSTGSFDSYKGWDVAFVTSVAKQDLARLVHWHDQNLSPSVASIQKEPVGDQRLLLGLDEITSGIEHYISLTEDSSKPDLGGVELNVKEYSPDISVTSHRISYQGLKRLHRTTSILEKISSGKLVVRQGEHKYVRNIQESIGDGKIHGNLMVFHRLKVAIVMSAHLVDEDLQPDSGRLEAGLVVVESENPDLFQFLVTQVNNLRKFYF